MARTLMALLAAAVLVAGLDAQPRAAEKPGKRQEALAQFHKMTPKERFDHVAKSVGLEKALAAVIRADLDLTIVERGSVECADATDVISRVAGQAVVKWVIDDGTMVKKGDRLLELDDASLREQLRTQTIRLEQAHSARLTAEVNLKLARKEGELAVRTGELGLKLARLELKRDDGTDADRKEILELKVAQAQLALEVATLRGRVAEAKAAAEVKARTSVEEQQASRKTDIEAQLAGCVILAPQAGLVVHYVPEQSRFGAGTPPLALGEPVREGQKMLRVCGLERFTLLTRIHEAQISRVRVGQAAGVRVDAFPKEAVRGQVKAVSPVAAQLDWLTRDVKVYPVTVDLPAAPRGLKPGMSAEIRLEGDRLAKVVQVPAGALARIGRETFCYVRIGKELQERKVTLGARNAQNVEVKDGLKEGEEVLRAP